MATKKTTPARPRTPGETWKAIEAGAREDEIDRFLAMKPDEIDARLRASGVDPQAIRHEGAEHAKKMSADRARLAWQIEAAVGLSREQARIDARPPRYAALSRAELLDRLAVARKNPRLAQPVAVMFRNRKTEEASEDELRALLEEIDALAEGDDGD